jgi:Lysozyme like domain
MTVLSPGEIKAYAAQAGFSGQALNTMVAIALAESGGDTSSQNVNDPNGGSFGLVQINGSHFHSGGTSKTCALDPQCSMNYAYELYTSQGFEPWGSYDPHSTDVTPAYEQFLATAEQAPMGAIPAPGHIPVNPANPPAGGLNFFSQLGNLVPWLSDPLRIFKLIGGIALIAISLLFLVVPGAVDTATSTVNKFQKAIPGL